MTAPADSLHDRQFAFAAHLRDASKPVPPDIEPRRLADSCAIAEGMWWKKRPNAVARND